MRLYFDNSRAFAYIVFSAANTVSQPTVVDDVVGKRGKLLAFKSNQEGVHSYNFSVYFPFTLSRLLMFLAVLSCSGIKFTYRIFPQEFTV